MGMYDTQLHAYISINNHQVHSYSKAEAVVICLGDRKCKYGQHKYQGMEYTSTENLTMN